MVLLVGVLALDTYEYVSVPGADEARNTIHTGIENFSGMEIMTKEERAALSAEIESAKALVAAKHKELENIMFKMENEEKKKEAEKAREAAITAAKMSAEVDNKKSDEIKVAPDSTTVTKPEETRQQEDERNDHIIETILEKELGIDKFCGDCMWKNTFRCDHRVAWMVDRYKITMDVAKEAVLDECTKPTGRALRRSA